MNQEGFYMATLQILGAPPSTYTRIVRMVAHEKGGTARFHRRAAAQPRSEGNPPCG
jgi:hypothetical protein